MCGEPARTRGWWDPHFFHSAVLDLGPVALAAAGVDRPSATPIVVYYQAWSAGLGSATRSFRVPSVGANETLRVCVCVLLCLCVCVSVFVVASAASFSG